MLATLVVALSLGASRLLDVPYLPQTDKLCGGAAAAMVLRYWGDTHADAQAFARLVDRRAGGIVDEALVAAVRQDGWRVERADSSIDGLRARLDAREPVIVLIPDRGTRYHYVVVVGTTDDAVVVHDPAWGPSRSISTAKFERQWKAAGFWSMVILPGANASTSAAAADAPVVRDAPHVSAGQRAEGPGQRASECDARLDRAMTAIRASGLDSADAALDEVRRACPNDARPVAELGGVRFAQHRWTDAVALAREALTLDAHEAYALDVLGSSLFMQDDQLGALRAWNQIGKPRVNAVRIDGLHHTRYETIADALDIQPNTLLTAEAFERARRRLGQLPDRTSARLTVRPESDSFATVDVVIVELSTFPHGTIDWTSIGVHAAVDREVGIGVPGFTGQGDVWSASWRWWSNRPAVGIAYTTPHFGVLPGVWRVDGSWQSDAFALPNPPGGAAPITRESRGHGGLTMSDWLSGSVRYSLTTGFDSWSDITKAFTLGASIERRLSDDRIALVADAGRWISVDGGPSFSSASARARWLSSNQTHGWMFRGEAGAGRVSDDAPLGLWPGAGDGHAREALLRAHPLLDDGVIDLTGSSVFGRSLVGASVDSVRWLPKVPVVGLGLAGFLDVAHAWRQATAVETPTEYDVGVGVRMKIPGVSGLLRVDVAHGLRDGANALTFGIIR
jgi:predicted double-glycine peptidase